MMLSTRKSITSAFRVAALVAGMALLSACGTTSGIRGNSGIAVDASQPVRVALLVPLGTGDPGRENIARSIINAAELASSDLRNASIDLAIYPTAGTTGGGASAASQAVAEGAKIILGPLFSTATAGAQPVADAAGVTIMSFSNNPEVAGANVYILGNTFYNSARRLVAYGRSRGLSNFGVVYPNGLEGDTARNAVAQAVQQGGGSLVATEGYNLSYEGIKAASPSIAASLQGRGANAVILTDGPTGGLAFIAEGLRSNGLTPSGAQFMGMQQWDASAEALSLPALQGGVFAAPDPSLQAAFTGRYQNTYGARPHDLASLGFDAVAAVGAMIAEARSGGGSPFSTKRITQSSGFAGATGPFRFNPNGTNQRTLAIIEVRGGQAVVTEGAARSFGGFGN
jgi:ABC-type branched-subunit amino acid transport system substrate-binding protein